MAYRLPSSTSTVSCSWQCHKDRATPSSEPGTDYAAPYGSTLYAVGAGKVVDIQTSNANATGRYITIDLNDGRRTRSLHLSSISVSVGQTVAKGDVIGKTGASGYGSDWGYGAHVHQTLWSSQSYSFCSTCTIDFAKYTSDDLDANQRIVGENGVNGRENPNTSGGVTQTLPAGTIADFDGWIKGETVDGNAVWYRGAYSGDYFWSGGFTKTGKSGLEDLNDASLGATERQVVSTASANGRAEPNTSSDVLGSSDPGTVIEMDGWITGEEVEGNDLWYRRKSNGRYFWSGGFTTQSSKGLDDLNPDEPVPDDTVRTVGAASANIRPYPYTTSTATSSADPDTDIVMKAWCTGETVEGNAVWFQRDSDEYWMWSGGFTSQSTDGLDEVDAPEVPEADADNPRDLATYTPVYPWAFQGLEAPLGFTNCDDPQTRTPRDTAGSDGYEVDPIIDTYIVHWTGTMVDQMDWFSYCNSRSVCPTWYDRRDGSSSEMIRPGAKPAATGPDWNWRSVAVESLADEDNNFTDEQWEQHAQRIAWLASYDGAELDGVPVSFSIDREHVLGHRECEGQSTECPGDVQMDLMDDLIERAKEIYEDEYGGTDPCEDCDCPDCPDTGEIDYDKIAQVVNDEHARRMSGG